MMRIVSRLAVAALFAMPALLCAQDDARIEKGKAVYAANKCQSCHLVDGKGNKRFPLDGVGAKLSEEDIRNWIIAPAEMEAKLTKPTKIKMKAYKLSPEDLDALVAYMRTLK